MQSQKSLAKTNTLPYRYDSTCSKKDPSIDREKVSAPRAGILLSGTSPVFSETDLITPIQKERKILHEVITQEMKQLHQKGINKTICIHIQHGIQKTTGNLQKIIRIKNVSKVSVHKNNMQKQIIFLFCNNSQ